MLYILHSSSDICKEGVIVGGACYWLPYRTGPKINLQKASDLCSFHGGVLAEIPSEKSYRTIFNYVKRSWYLKGGVNRVQVWLRSVYLHVSKSLIILFLSLIRFKSLKELSFNLRSTAIWSSLKAGCSAF